MFLCSSLEHIALCLVEASDLLTVANKSFMAPSRKKLQSHHLSSGRALQAAFITKGLSARRFSGYKYSLYALDIGSIEHNKLAHSLWSGDETKSHSATENFAE
jgi:hypothetical protein